MFKFFYNLSRRVPFGCAILRVLFTCDIPRKTKIGKNVRFGHKGLGIVIHENAVIEDDVFIQHHATIGVSDKDSGLPVIKKGAFIGPYAMVLGGVTIGERASIGAGSIVMHDVPADTVYFNKREHYYRNKLTKSKSEE